MNGPSSSFLIDCIYVYLRIGEINVGLIAIMCNGGLNVLGEIESSQNVRYARNNVHVKVAITNLSYIQHRYHPLKKLSKRVSACYDLRQKGNIVVSEYAEVTFRGLVTCVGLYVCSMLSVCI